MVLEFVSLNWYEWLVAITTAVIGTSALIKAIADIREKGWGPFRDRWFLPWRDKRRRREELVGIVNEMKETLNTVAAELKTNGGSSLKDMVYRLDGKVDDLKARSRHKDEMSEQSILELDSNWNLRYANCAFRDLVSADENELTHRNYISRIRSDERPRFMAEVRDAVENKMPLETVVNFRLNDNRYLAVRLHLSPDVRPGGELLGFFGTATTVDN